MATEPLFNPWFATVTFDDPAPRLNLNDRLHWAQRAKHVKAWRHTTCDNTANAWRNFPPATVEVVFGVPNPGLRRDPHNWMPTVKAIIDGLVDAGVWADDDSTHVTVLEPRFAKGKGVTVCITPRTKDDELDPWDGYRPEDDQHHPDFRPYLDNRHPIEGTP
jgi:Holliday junction resolvase RusA-like endonuclease